MKYDRAQGIIIAPIWPEQSWYTKLKNLPIKFLFIGQSDKILEMRQRMKDKDQKLPPDNGAPYFWICPGRRKRLANEIYEDERDWLDIERITIDEMMKKDAEVILTEVIAFHTRQNYSVASAKLHKACLTTMLSLIHEENLASQTTSKLINKALANATVPHRRYQNICILQILFNHWRESKQNKYFKNYDLQVKIASLLMSICFFRPNKIAEIRLKVSNFNKTENQASLRLAPKQANAIETYEVYETDNEKLAPKLAIYEWIDRLKKQFPKGTDFLLWHKGFNKPTTTKNISLQLTKLLRELKMVRTSAYAIRHSTTKELAKLEQMTQLGNQQVIPAKIMKGQTRYLNKEVKQGEKGVTNYYLCLLWRQGNDLLSQYLLISPLVHPKYVSQPEVKLKQGENSLEN
ncbi:MAG: hypothetical protein EZS28_022210 [Streblomastix strix]|uniref:Tyr recombinase domain-containing protein n=1 Tax=Streblomastix strix TaxID=222440 RepID=A0A5J4VII3_9EUKA|nr:MAG: hypothetical protein EZS28_022210 [Streblomastix strix]